MSEQQPPLRDEADIGHKLLVLVMVFIAFSIILFGMVLALNANQRTRVAGAVIIGIGIFDLLMTRWISKKLPTWIIKTRPEPEQKDRP